ncbi:MAG: hypothetical protein HY094_05300 [Candidatus Melainabacteria bacterium]|nr:hypothetical protein [Candidatus Melainabacteria bacterium]
MNKIKLIAFLFLALSAVFTTVRGASATCSIRTLKNVCDVCEERGLKKSGLSTDSLPAEYPKVNCPEASLACIRTDSFGPFLKSSYTLTAMIDSNGDDVLFKLNTLKDPSSPQKFSYDVRSQNFRTVIQNGSGFIIYDVVNFNLPVYNGENILSYNCIGGIDNSSVIKGLCSTIANNGNGSLQLYGFQFTAIPNVGPLQ